MLINQIKAFFTKYIIILCSLFKPNLKNTIHLYRTTIDNIKYIDYNLNTYTHSSIAMSIVKEKFFQKVTLTPL